MADLTFKELLLILKKKWWFIITVTCLAVLVAGYLSFYYFTPMYTNSTTLLVNDREQNLTNNIRLDDVMLYEKLIGTYKDIIVSKRILGDATKQFNIAYEDLVKMVSVSSKANSQVITLSVTSSDYKGATQIANFIAETFRVLLPDIMTVDNVQILDPAQEKANPQPVKPNKKLNIALAFILGLLFSSSLVVIYYFIDSRVREETDFGNLTDLPVLGTIPRYDKKSRRGSHYLGR